MTPANKIFQVYPDTTILHTAAANLFVKLAQTAVADHGHFTVALSGGSTPQQLYELLAQEPFCQQIPWQQVLVFWGDERHVPPDDPQSNQRMARLALLNKVPIPAENIIPMAYEASPEETARHYETQLYTRFNGQVPRFDLILLGLGTDGHTASLFPGTSAVTEKTRWTCTATPLGQTLTRITLTLPVINAAANILFLVAGESKAAVMGQIAAQSHSQPLPAQLVNPVQGTLLWLLDKAAGQQLEIT